MALTFRNVTGQNTNAGTSSLRTAGSLFGKAFDNFNKTAESEKKEERANLLFQQSQENRVAKQGRNKVRDAQNLIKFNRAITADDKRIEDSLIQEEFNNDDILNNAATALQEANGAKNSLLSQLPEDKVLNPTEQLAADKSLTNRLAKDAPDEVFGGGNKSTLDKIFGVITGETIGGALTSSQGKLGGDELANEIQNIKKEGVNVNGVILKPTSTELEQAFGNVAENLNDNDIFSTDTNVRKSDLENELVRILLEKNARRSVRNKANTDFDTTVKRLQAIKRQRQKSIRDSIRNR